MQAMMPAWSTSSLPEPGWSSESAGFGPGLRDGLARALLPGPGQAASASPGFLTARPPCCQFPGPGWNPRRNSVCRSALLSWALAEGLRPPLGPWPHDSDLSMPPGRADAGPTVGSRSPLTPNSVVHAAHLKSESTREQGHTLSRPHYPSRVRPLLLSNPDESHQSSSDNSKKT